MMADLRILLQRISWFALVLICFFPVLGYTSTGLTIQPVKISHTIEPGATTTESITLTNASEEAVTVDMKIEDFVPTAGAQGIQFVGRAPGLTTVRDWITLDGKTPFVLERGETRTIGYTIVAPPNAEPGSHFGVAFFKASKANQGGEQLKVGTQVGVLIFVTVPGNFLQKGVIHSFTAPRFSQRPPITFKINFENTGTVHFEPKGTITVTNIFGKEVAQLPIEGQVVLPTGARELAVSWTSEHMLLGRYKATAVIGAGDGEQITTQPIVFYVVPVWYGLGFFAAVIAVFLVFRFLVSRVKISVSLRQ